MDLQNSKFRFIPNELYEFIKLAKSESVSGIIKKFDHEESKIVMEYFEFLIDNEYGFWCTKKELSLFPALESKWESPFAFSNVILDIDKKSNYNLEKAVVEVISNSIPHIQLRVYDGFELEDFGYFLKLFENSPIYSIELLVPFIEKYNLNYLGKFIVAFPRITGILVHGCPEGWNAEHVIEESPFVRITFQSYSISDCHSCGVTELKYFGVNTELYMESQKYNSCLNRKISIDVNGFIRNCPSSKDSFGHIDTTTFLAALNDPGFKGLWKISKDKILVCRDCEFRYMCTDCRAYLTNPNNICSKPLKCGYDPYSGQWTDWNKSESASITFQQYRSDSSLT